MPYFASIGTHLSCWRAPVAEINDLFTGIELISYLEGPANGAG